MCFTFIFFLAYVKPSENAYVLFCHPFLFCPSLCLHAMGLSDDELPSNGSTSDSDAKTLVSKRTNTSKSSTHRAKTQKKVKKDAKPKAKSKAVDEDKRCTILRCHLKRKAKAVYCINHARDVAAMKYQAEKQGESGLFDELATDATKLSEALEEFDRVNPKGRWRKGLIDWTQFKKSFTHTPIPSHSDVEKKNGHGQITMMTRKGWAGMWIESRSRGRNCWRVSMKGTVMVIMLPSGFHCVVNA